MADNKISASKLNIYNSLLNVMTTSNQGEKLDVDYLRTGFMGYALESMALIVRDGAIHKSMLANEAYLNTAVLPRTVYNWAKMFNIDVSKATPASTNVIFTLRISDLDNVIGTRIASDAKFAKHGTDVSSMGGSNVIIIDKENPLYYGETIFSLEKSLIIYKNASSNYIIKYCNTDVDRYTNYMNDNTVFLKTTEYNVNGEAYISFVAQAFQYEKRTYGKTITSTSFVDAKIHTFEFVDQLVGLNLKYAKNGDVRKIDVRFSDMDKESDQLIAFYNVTDTNTLQIKFTNENFVPSAGGELQLDILTTKGSAANKTYTGEAIFILNDEDFRNLLITATFQDNLATGGVDTPSVNKIKNTIINEISSRNTIVTESDLNEYFAQLTSLLEIVNDGQVKFIKKRDDIMKRVFGTYILMRDGLNIDGVTAAASGYKSNVIPTNTIDVTMYKDGNSTIPYGKQFKYNKEVGFIEAANNTLDSDVYVLPFTMRVMTAPYKHVKYIYNLTDSESVLSTSTINVSANVILNPNSVRVTRDYSNVTSGTKTTKSKYSFVFSFTTNYDMSKCTYPGIQLKLFKSANISSNLDFTYDPSTPNSNCTILTTNNSGVYENKIILYVNVNDDEFTFSDSSDVATNIMLSHDGAVIQLPEEVSVVLNLEGTSGLLGELYNIDFKADTKLRLFTNLDDMMYSDVIEKQLTIDGKNYTKSLTIKDVPVVHASFFNNEINQSKFIKQLFVYINMLRDNTSKLETNTYFDLKFYNTYGNSTEYGNTSTTNLRLDLNVHMRSGVTSLDIQDEIKDYIRVLVDVANTEESLSVSRVISLTTAAYNQYIEYIEFAGLNNTLVQHIELVKTSSIATPEYFNVNKSNLDGIKFITK